MSRPVDPPPTAVPSPATRPTLTEAQQNAVAELVRVSPVVDDLSRRFAERGHQLYLVGGSVRDALLGRLGDDLDFTTDARPDDILAAVKGWAEGTWDIGRAFGTIGVLSGGLKLEITTFRADSYDPDSRHPEVEFGDTLAGDLGRRDFAINAMAVRLPDWKAPDSFVDLFGGLDDLAAGVIRTPGTAQMSFTDDPLRMLRAARFAAQLGFTPSQDVVAAMTKLATRLEIISAERVREELSKLLLAPQPRVGLELLVRTGLAELFLPELPALQLEIDEHHQHKDVYVHTLTVLERAMRLEQERPEVDSPDLVLRMAALLHDIGKPPTRRMEAGGGVSFHHHEVVGAKMTRKRLRALTYPKAFVQDVERLVFLHLRFHGYGKGEWTDSAVRRYVTDAGPLLDRLHLLVRSDCTTRNRRRAQTLSDAYDELEQRIAILKQQEELDAIRPDLDGAEVMELLGVGPGRVVGLALKHLLALRMEHGPMGHEAAVAELRRWAADNGVGPAASG